MEKKSEHFDEFENFGHDGRVSLISFCTGIHHEYFCRSAMCFRIPIYVRKYRKCTIDRRIVVYTVCASAVISPLRQWLDSYAKTRLKMWHTFKHFIHMQYVLLLTNLVIVFVHWVTTGVLHEPRQCSLFWDYISESKLFFASICAARPVHIQSDQYRSCSTVNDARWARRWVLLRRDGEQPTQRCGSEFEK